MPAQDYVQGSGPRCMFSTMLSPQEKPLPSVPYCKQCLLEKFCKTRRKSLCCLRASQRFACATHVLSYAAASEHVQLTVSVLSVSSQQKLTRATFSMRQPMIKMTWMTLRKLMKNCSRALFFRSSHCSSLAQHLGFG